MELLIGQILALITALCWAQNALIYAHVGAKISSNTTAHIRLWIALPLILIIHLIFEGTLFPQHLSSRSIILIGISGVLGFCVADLCIFHSFVKLGARQTMVVMTTSPIFGAILARILYQETLKGIQVFGMMITLSGVVLVILSERSIRLPGSPNPLQGLFIALLGALTQAIAMVFAKIGMQEGLSAISTNVLRLSFGWMALVLYAIINRSIVRDFSHFTHKKGQKYLLLILLAAFMGPVFGIILNLQALKLAPVGIVTTLSQTTPIMLLPIERLIFKKHIPKKASVGTIVAVFGTIMLFL